jgi:[acyl-carrier-protein] S-malonyltransferase
MPSAQENPDITTPAGEALHVLERIIVAPTIGVFHRLDRSTVARGDVIGTVQSLGTATAIQSPFEGVLVGFLALEGERVRPGQPVAWLRLRPRSRHSMANGT